MRDAVDCGWLSAATPAGRLALDPALGNLRSLIFQHNSCTLEPLHTAPWVDAPDDHLPDDLIPIERRLAGEFFCAPFGTSDVETAPAHGWSANSQWDLVSQTGGGLHLSLAQRVMGAHIAKRLWLSPDAPLLYQKHTISGGRGLLTVAHHPMILLAAGGRFFCSDKRAVLTPDKALEPGRNRLAVAARATDLTSVPAADGARVDLSRLPIGDAHEDFVTLVEARLGGLGWSAILRAAEDDIVFFLKDPSVLPVTMLWHSNGGRDYSPWDGRHRGVLGVEDGCAAGASGHAAAAGANPVAAEGVPTVLTLAAGRDHVVPHVIGAIPRPQGWIRVEDIQIKDAALVITGDSGSQITLPFDPAFFKEIG